MWVTVGSWDQPVSSLSGSIDHLHILILLFLHSLPCNQYTQSCVEILLLLLKFEYQLQRNMQNNIIDKSLLKYLLYQFP